MSKPRNERQRTSVLTTFSGVSTQRFPSGTVRDDPVSVNVLETQRTVSEGNRWPPPKGSNGDFGGDFFTTRTTRSSSFRKGQWSAPEEWGWPRVSYQGDLGAVHPGIDPSQTAGRSEQELNAMGATAIARCKPTNSPANAFVFLTELYKDKIPHLVGSTIWKAKTGQARKATADEHLNLQFGWMPIFNDIKDFLGAVYHADRVLTQFERDAGRNVRRRYRFSSKPVISEEILSPAAVPFGYSGSPTGPFGVITRHTTVSSDVWFSGAFTYHLPSGYDSRNKMERYARRAEYLLGTDMSPAKIWQIAPWSWAVDWFANTGNVISNLTDFASGGLVMRYGYIMETSTVTDIYTNEGSGLFGQKLVLPPFKVETITKKRYGANPFGFGVVWNGLSPFQLSILAALGISKGSK